MRIACVDDSAADRVVLQKLLDASFQACRGTIGHVQVAVTYPATKDEVTLNGTPDCIVVGPAFSNDVCYAVSRELRDAHPNTPVVVFLDADRFSLRTLLRLERVSSEVFRTDESPVRIVHKLSSLAAVRDLSTTGPLVCIQGVKGGVGATSIVTGLAHAAQTLGRSAVVIDLSAASSLCHYLGARRWQSPDYTAALLEDGIADRSLAERCVTVSPNGISLLLPPSGGTDVRDIWLRSPVKFETTLALIDSLQEQFDVVLVDLAGVEGVLRFALVARAHCNLLVTSNDPAAVHLLSRGLSAMTEAPGSSTIRIVVNLLQQSGLTNDDVLDFLYANSSFEPEMANFEPLPFDAGALHWIGTGNSFYTEGSRVLQKRLDAILSKILPGEDVAQAKAEPDASGALRRLMSLWKFPARLEGRSTGYRLLPLNVATAESKQGAQVLRPTPAVPVQAAHEVQVSNDSLQEEPSDTLYEPPTLAVGE